MKTQGVSSLVQTGLSHRTAKPQAAKSDASGFDSFMSDSTKTVDKSSAAESTVSPEVKRPAEKDYVKLKDSQPATETGKEMISKQPSYAEQAAVSGGTVVEEIQTEQFDERLVTALSQLFSMSEEEITDILEQGGIDFGMLLFQIQPDNTVSLLNQEMLQKLVMDVHGIEDRSVFLTSDLLNRELTQLTEVVKELGAELFNMAPEEFLQMEQPLLQSFAEHLMAGSEDSRAALAQDFSETAETSDIREEAVPTAQAEKPVVTVEAYIKPEQGSMQGDGSQTEQGGSTLGTMTEEHALFQEDTGHVDSAGLFAEHLARAWSDDAGESVASPEAVMRQIVEQIVRQVRIRVLPETTRMELQLHPESLGKVNLQVSSTGGVSTALLVVENQVAKEALESQMITLKQSFEEQGLKVNAVEVTVSEFGLNQNQESADGQKNGSRGKRSFREDAGKEAVEETFENMAQTEEARRNSDSVVDYTA